jgi:sn-glycerol 3-phosphate transport system permease protein
MVENRPWLTFMTHGVLILGVLVVAFPIYVAFVASTHELDALLRSPMPLIPGSSLVENYTRALTEGAKAVGTPVWLMMFNSLVMAVGIAFGKIAISLLASFSRSSISDFGFGCCSSG